MSYKGVEVGLVQINYSFVSVFVMEFFEKWYWRLLRENSRTGKLRMKSSNSASTFAKARGNLQFLKSGPC